MSAATLHKHAPGTSVAVTERFEEAIATVTAKEHYSFDHLGPGRLVGSGDLCNREGPLKP